MTHGIPKIPSLLLCTLIMTTKLLFCQTEISLRPAENNNYELSIIIDATHQNFIDKNSIQLSVDHPDVALLNWSSSSEYTKQYDATHKETRKVYTTPCTITALISANDTTTLAHAHLHLAYYQQSAQGIVHEHHALAQQPAISNSTNTHIDTTQTTIASTTAMGIKPPEVPATSWSSRLSSLVETTESNGMRILLVLLLGLLMSLTPCIYPMIPITVGILQAQGTKSFWQNSALSLAYTFGIATTFAALGLTAAVTGQLFGSLMANPIFILAVVAVLVYLGLSMLGFYDMYTPRFMRNANSSKGGSITAAFLFGAASGTVASPCLSPGLILLLSIVAALGSKLMGFILLFSFGIGLSIPLLIIGTFSTSLMLLPSAGMWMVEIKKFFGVLLFGMCFYFLQNIMPWEVLLGLGSVTLLALGIFYLKSIAPFDSKAWKSIKNICGITFIAASVFTAVQTVQSIYSPKDSLSSASFWLYDYHEARQTAIEQHRNLFIDIGASYCSICKAIDRTILSHPRVIEALKPFIAVKLDASECIDVMSELQERYAIRGVPTILIIKPDDGTLIKKWGSEIYDLSIDEVVQQLNQ